MADRLPLTDDIIRDRAGSQSYSKGQSYYRGGAVFDTVRRENRLEGLCEGSQASPYRIVVTFDEQGIDSAECTCPYDWGGDCKHIVALLLTYLHKPEQFETRPQLDAALQQRSKEELIAVIKAMLERAPELEILVDRPVPGQHPRQTPVNVESFRKEIRRAMKAYDGWGDYSPHSAVRSVTQTAAGFAKQGDWASARAIYSAILDETLNEEDGYYFDDEGEFDEAIGEAVDGLIECLNQPSITEDDAARRAALDSLVDVYLWDINMGGVGLSDEVPDGIFGAVRPPDIPALRQRIQPVYEAKRRSPYSSWSAESLADFLAELDALDNVDPEIVLKRLRDEGMFELLLKKLLALKRFDEAIALAQEEFHTPYERLQAAVLLAQHGREDAAIRLAETGLAKEFDHQLAGWLLHQYQQRGDAEARLRLLCQLMNHLPSVEIYRELESVAKGLGQWEAIRPPIIEALKKDKAQIATLARVYLHEQEWDLAWELVERAPQADKRSAWGSPYLYGPTLDLEVAQASRKERPHKAIPVFINYARRLIDQRNRGSYAEAANNLAEVKRLYTQIGDPAAWDALISGIREEFRRLPALQDELRKAGL